MTDIIMVQGRSSKRVSDALKRMVEDQRRSLEASTKEIQRLEAGLVREKAAQPSAPPRDPGGTQNHAPSVASPRLVYCAKQDVITLYWSGEISGNTAVRILEDQGFKSLEAIELLWR